MLNPQSLEKSLVPIQKQATSLMVKDVGQRKQAIDLLRLIREKRDVVSAFYKDEKAKKYKGWKDVCNEEGAFLDRLKDYREMVDKAVLIFDDEQERVRLIKETELKKAEEDRAETEKRRLEGIAKRTKDEEKKSELLTKAAATAPSFVSLPSAVEKQEGESKRRYWHYKITDLALLPREYFIPDAKLLQSVADAKKEQASVPGVEFYFTETLIVK
jgi:hypothetical protein